MADAFITHQPLLSRHGRIIASRLTLHVAGDAAISDAIDTLRHVEEYWPIGEQGIFLGFAGTALSPAFFDWMVPENAVLELQPHGLSDVAGVLKAARDSGAGLCLDFDAQVAQVLGAGFSFRFVGFDALRYTPAQIQALAPKLKVAGMPFAYNVDTPEVFGACSGAGMSACAGWFCTRPTGTPGKALAPNQAHIIRLLNMVRNDADVSQIETALKQDVALSYKLLRYINSAGFGLSCEIQSFRHAVTMLGYDKLHKWLSLLLVTASKDSLAPALMHAALTRARLMEVLGEGLVGKGESDNLFITGAFSTLDLLLGVSMDRALGEMHLPEPVADALLNRDGLYTPVLEIALACESRDGARLAELTGSLGLDPTQVNAALLQSLSFAATMSV